MEIRNDNKKKISANFYESEFYSKCLDAPESHYFDSNLILAAQYLRTFYNCELIINSTYRTTFCNLLANGKSNSQHLNGFAFDFYLKEKSSLDSLKNSILNQDAVFKMLRSLGVNGFGVYNSFIHLDTRPQILTLKHSDEYGRFAIWNNSDLKKKV